MPKNMPPSPYTTDFFGAGTFLGGPALPKMFRGLRHGVPQVDHGPRGRACPKCKAEPGQACNRATRGRHMYHAARLAND